MEIISPSISFRTFFKVAVAVGALCLVSGSAHAAPWASEPQPLIHDTRAIRADAGSPLAWDQSARVLWYVSYSYLSLARWNGVTFTPAVCGGIVPKVEAGMLVDDGLHLAYFADQQGILRCARRSPVDGSWLKQKIGNEPVTRLLAVDSRSHSIFAYDPAARGIRRYTYQGTTKSWSSTIIASGLGDAGDAAAWDSSLRVLYSSHETAELPVRMPARTHRSSAPTRNQTLAWYFSAPQPHADLASDPNDGFLLKPWPLVATSWDGKAWTSRVIDETGVPQLAAVRETDHTVFYARRDGLNVVRTYRPATAGRGELFGTESGWSGADTYEDNDSYHINVEAIQSALQSAFLVVRTNSSSFTIFSVSGNLSGIQITDNGDLKLTPPITVIPYYVPIFSSETLNPRLTHYRAVLNPKMKRLVQNREISSGEVAVWQTARQLAGYLYRDANGVLAVSLGAAYPALTPSFDLANPPANFANLADPLAQFSAWKDATSLGRLAAIPTTATVDPNAPFLPPHLRLPTSVRTRTFGHRYDISVGTQAGGRFRRYDGDGTSYADPSALEVDPLSGLTFYTQATPPVSYEDTVSFTDSHSFLPFTGFRYAPDFKQPRLTTKSVWIVMVY